MDNHNSQNNQNNQTGDSPQDHTIHVSSPAQGDQQFSNGYAQPPLYGAPTGYPQPPMGFVGQVPDVQHRRHHRRIIALVIAGSLACSLVGGAAGGLVVSAFTKRSTSEYSRFRDEERGMFGRSQHGSGNSSGNNSSGNSGSGTNSESSDGAGGATGSEHSSLRF